MRYDEYNELPETEDADQDKFLEDDTYEEYDGPDLSGDPMLEEEARKSWFARRKERKERERREEQERQRAALKAEILAEIKAEKEMAKIAEMEARLQQEQPSEEMEQEALDSAAKESRPKSKFITSMMTILSGNILSKAEVRKVYPYLLLLVFLMFLYIGNVFRMQTLHRQHERLTREVKELRAKSMTIASQKMNATRQSNIIQEIERRGLPLHESLAPNKVISKD